MAVSSSTRRKRTPRGPEDEARRLAALWAFEQDLNAKDVFLIAGVDEAGVGPLAGPVVAAAVILPRDYRLSGLDDSKKIVSHDKREGLAAAIKRDAVAWRVGLATVQEIDAINIYHAGLLAMRRAVEQLDPKPEHCLVDARTVPLDGVAQTAIVGGDGKSLSIAAASILAKTTRDGLMFALDAQWPMYGFRQHKGYPTASHVAALMAHGPSPAHRMSYAPVRAARAFP